MRAIVVAALLATLPTIAISEEPLKIPPDKQQAAQKAMMQLAFADQCNKRLDMPEMLADAQASFIRFMKDIDAEDPEGKAAVVFEKLASAPQKKEEPGGFTLFNPKLCGDVAKALREGK